MSRKSYRTKFNYREQKVVRAYQRAIDKVRTLPLTFSKGAQKANLLFKNRFSYISVIDEAIDFKVGMQLGFAEAHNKSNKKKKCMWFWARGDSRKLGLPFNTSATAGASDFKFGAPLGFAKAHHKITRRRKGGCGPGLMELSTILRFPFNIYTIL